MRTLLIVLVLLGIGVVGLAFYQGWFHLGSNNVDDKTDVTLTVNKDKFEEDKKKAVVNVQDMEHKIEHRAAGPSEKSLEGTVVSASRDKLVMADKEGKESSHTLAADVQVTCDGKTCTAEDLKPGMRLRVTTTNATSSAATRIEALDNNRDFKKGA